jgi:hypothetical protein
VTLGARGSAAALAIDVAVVLALAAGCGGGADSPATAPTRPEATETNAAGATGETDDTATPQAPVVVQGRGPTTRTITVPADLRPLVLSARYPKGDVLTANVRGSGFERLPETTGALVFDSPKTGETAVLAIAQGRYELRVKGTKGAWVLRFSEPDPAASTTSLVGERISGSGDTVRAVHLDQETELLWEMQTDGLFLLGQLLGYGEAEGAAQFLGILQGGFLFQPGDRGLRTDAPLPAGNYLLVIDADRQWEFTFVSVH